MAISIAVASRNSLLTSYGAFMNSGQLAIFSGTVPTNADTALSGNAVLVGLPLSSTAFGTASAGSETANAITQENAYSSGTATFYRLVSQGSSGAATAMVANGIYMINVPGNTVWATYGAPNSSAGTVFVANGAGTGTGTCYPMTTVEQGTAGTSGTDLVLNTTSIVSGGPVAITSLIRTM